MAASKLRMGIAADHGGKDLKRLVRDFLVVECSSVVDFGVSEDAQHSVDYPDYAALIAESIISGKIDAGVAICGTGIGMAMVANRYPGVRAALIWDEFTARMSKQHNDANLVCLGARTINHLRAVDFVRIWLDTTFEGGRHQERLRKMREIEKKQGRP